MQRVIEEARAQTYAAFMNTAPAQIPAAVPPILPAAVPDFRSDRDKDRDSKRRRSRSRSWERSDRSRDRSRERDGRRDRKHRSRSRSRSRERRERRRRDRSRSRSRDRDRSDRRNSRDRQERSQPNYNRGDNKQPWSNQQQTDMLTQAVNQGQPVFSTMTAEDQRQKLNLNQLGNNKQPGNNFNANFNGSQTQQKNNWTPNNFSNPSTQRTFLTKPEFMSADNPRPSLNKIGENQKNFFNRNDNFASKKKGLLSRSSSDSDCCVKLNPFFGGYGDIRRFFQGLFISNKGIKLINDETGHRTGLAYVKFGHAQGRADALLKDGKMMKGIQVEVKPLDDDEFEEAVDRYVPEGMESDIIPDDVDVYRNNWSKGYTKYFNQSNVPEDFRCVVIDDLPTYCKEQDILHMFSMHALTSVILTTKPKGGHIAYAQFSNREEAQKALEEVEHHVVSGKSVTVRPCSDEEFQKINKQHDVDISGFKVSVQDIGTECVIVSNLPIKTNDRDVADFFSDIGVTPLKINFIPGSAGKACCEFETSEEATKSIKKDNTSFGNTNVSVKPISRNEMMKLLGMNTSTSSDPKPPKIIPPNMNQQNNRMNINLNDDPSKRPMPFMDMNPRMERPNFHPRPFFNRNFNGPMFRGGRGGPRFGPRGMGPRFTFNPPPPRNDMNDDHQAPEGCTVYMNNVPYKAGTGEILEFFDGFDIINNQVSRRFNHNNTPSAEARVVFRNPDEAYRAVQERNGEKIWDRAIFLKQS